MKKLFVMLVAAALGGQVAAAQEAAAEFPNNLHGGYWAMVDAIGDNYGVVNFYQKDGVQYSDNYAFSCEDGEAKLVNTETAVVVPNDGKVSLKLTLNSPAFAELELIMHNPNENLILKQTATDEMMAFKQMYPDGILFGYTYSPTLKPTCGK